MQKIAAGAEKAVIVIDVVPPVRADIPSLVVRVPVDHAIVAIRVPEQQVELPRYLYLALSKPLLFECSPSCILFGVLKPTRAK